MSVALGEPFMPWQRHFADVAGEVDPATGRLAYRTVILKVPRRGGKSLSVLSMMLARARFPTPQRIWYAAQTGKNVTKKWRQEWAPMVDASPVLRDTVRARLSQGSEEFVVSTGRHRSFISAFSASREDLHSQSGDLVVFDEAWVHSAAAGAELMKAARPLMATRTSPQLFIVSAAGDADSDWFADWCAAGREAVDADTGDGICYVEYSADRDGLDLTDEAVWIDAHPAVRHAGNPHGTIDVQFLHDEYADSPETFNRSYLNIADTSAGSGRTLIDVATFTRLGTDPLDLDRLDAVAFGVDSAPDQEYTSIVAAAFVDGVAVVELVDRRPGHAWAPARLAELAGRYPLNAVALDGGSPAGVLVSGLRRAGLPVRLLELRDVTAAAGQFVGAVSTGDVRHVPDPQLDAAVTGARRRTIGDGSWTFGRRAANVDVSPLIAACFARYALVDAPEPGIS